MIEWPEPLPDAEQKTVNMEWPEPLPDAEQKAVDMARALVRHCKKNKLPRQDTQLIAGVAINGSLVHDAAYKKGVEHERKRICKILGL